MPAFFREQRLESGVGRGGQGASLLLIAALFLSSCGDGKKRSSQDPLAAAAPSPSPAVEPKEPQDPIATTVPVASPTENPSSPGGEPVPPIGEAGETIRSGAGAVKRLIFESSDAVEVGRHKSEFLISLQAKERSCIRLKVRPTDGLEAVISEEALSGEIDGTGACTGKKVFGEEKTPGKVSEEETDGDKPAQSANLALTNTSALEWGKTSQQKSFYLAATPTICAKRLFRMPARKGDSAAATTGANLGLENVVQKTGTLVRIGSKVRIWVDDEFADYCAKDYLKTDSPLTPFGPYIEQTRGALSNSNLDASTKATVIESLEKEADRLLKEQLDTFTDELDYIATKMSATFGAFSDIDESGFIEVFLSPEVNRYNLALKDSFDIDDLTASMIYRPEDLAHYNAETNPLSNEGEIIYLWTPDPAGIYNFGQFASSNSVVSNFAKGFLASQLMTLIITNEKMLVRKLANNEETWLTQGLALLASAYYAGNDYSVQYLAEFYSSRPQTLSLTDPLNDTLFTGEYLRFAADEQLGLRALFAWYLHERACPGPKVTPCADLKELIASDTIGKQNVEDLLKLGWEEILENFGLSVGVSLIDKNEAEIAALINDLWRKSENLPAKPVVLGKVLRLIRDTTGERPLSAQTNDEGVLFEYPDSANNNYDGKVDQTAAAPIPNPKSLLFQVVSTDNDIEFKMDKDSIAIILLTGLVEDKTDVTAVFGPGITATFLPIGEFDEEKRRVHIEKVSESAHEDHRPVNLTSEVEVDRANKYPKAYDSEANFNPNLDFRVTRDRELWVVGSIDNYLVNIGGASSAVSDTDSYVIEIDPCLDLPMSDPCQTQTHEIAIQTYIRDFDLELAPIQIIGDTDLNIYRGHSIFGRVDQVSTLEAETEAESEQSAKEIEVRALCESRFSVEKREFNFVDGDDVGGVFANQGLTIHLPDHGFSVGDTIEFSVLSGALPRPLLMHKRYRVRTATTDHLLVQGIGSEFDASAPVIIGGQNVVQLTDLSVDPADAQVATYEEVGGVFEFSVNADWSGVSEVELLPAPDSILGDFAAGSTDALVKVVGRLFTIDDIRVVGGVTTFSLAFRDGRKLRAASLSGPHFIHQSTPSIKSSCLNAGLPKAVYDFETFQQKNGFLHGYQNYLSLGHKGFPFSTRSTITYPKKEPCELEACIDRFEADRNYLQYKFSAELKPYHYKYFAMSRDVDLPVDPSGILTGDNLVDLIGIKQRIEECPYNKVVSEAFVDTCAGIPQMSEQLCFNICTDIGVTVQSRLLAWIASLPNPGLVCRQDFCPDGEVLLNHGDATVPWFRPQEFFHYLPSSTSLLSYYQAIEPRQGLSVQRSYCLGQPLKSGTLSQRASECLVTENHTSQMKDNRQQFNVSAAEFGLTGCGDRGRLFGDDLLLCYDLHSYALETFKDKARAYASIYKTSTIAQARARGTTTVRKMPIASQARETISKPERIHGQLIYIVGKQKINVMIGSRGESQGKYLLRVRVMPQNPP